MLLLVAVLLLLLLLAPLRLLVRIGRLLARLVGFVALLGKLLVRRVEFRGVEHVVPGVSLA